MYITTTLPYANSLPHLGHAIEFVQADAYARYFRDTLGPERVFFNLGLDEHGQKLLNTAHQHGQEPGEFLEGVVPGWLDFCRKFRVSHDHFYRTTSAEHHRAAQAAWRACAARGDIYRRHYEGLYCVGCEAYKLERDLVNGLCPDHGTAPVTHSEENYFFRLSAYGPRIALHLEEHPGMLKPASKRQELLNFLANLEDISISRSRSSLAWGIPVPDDPDHTMYVWFDALTNYINVIGHDRDRERLSRWWPGIQLCGPDNLRFQGAIWQGMLASLGLPFTRTLLVHGTIFGPDGQKMSKSLGNVISPLEQYERFGADRCRFYLLGVLQTYGDGSYREEDLVSACNTHLSNTFGNLVSRVIQLAIKREIALDDESLVDPEIRSRVDTAEVGIREAYEQFELHTAVERIQDLLGLGNRYLHEQEPWKQDGPAAAISLNTAAHIARRGARLYQPIIPDGATRAIEALDRRESVTLFPRI
jgi:methionyl-tRNA synthetase